MSFEPIYEVAVLDGLTKLCSAQVAVESKLVPTHGEEITKILGVSSIADVVTTEVFAGEARIKGKVDFKVLYANTNGENRCLVSTVEFTDKMVGDEIAGGNPCVNAKVLDTDIVSASASEIRLAAVVEVELFGQVTKRIKYLVKGGDGVHAYEHKAKYTKVLSGFTGNCSITAESSVSAKYIECFESRIATTKITSSTDIVVIEGEVISDVVYRGEGGIGHVSLSTPFVFEVEATGAISGSEAVATLRISSSNANIIEGEENTVIINYSISAIGYAYENRTLDCVADAFSVKNELVKQEEAVSCGLVKTCACFADEIDGSVTLEAGLPIVDNIVTPIGSSVIISSVYATNGKVVIEGLLRSNVVYFSGESNSCNSVTVELPFSVNKPMEASENDRVFATAEVLGINIKIRRGNEIDVRADVRFSVCISEDVKFNIITDLALGAEVIAPQSAISMHIASKRETLWDVAKAFCVSPETVMEQNPELSFPLVGGERIICFRRLTK
ncbi:MAG: DUF3794 domain-containing protein [Clostridia bacterium]|nr:DUF3794 domain-containing protein [Clostridia bacterium]